LFSSLRGAKRRSNPSCRKRISGFLRFLTSVRPSVEFVPLIFLVRPKGRDHAPPAVDASPLPALVPATLALSGSAVRDISASRADNSNSILEWIGSVTRRRDHEIKSAVDVSNLASDPRPREIILEIVRAVVHCFNRHWDDATSNVEPLGFSFVSLIEQQHGSQPITVISKSSQIGSLQARPPVGAGCRTPLESALGLPAIKDHWRNRVLIFCYARLGRECKQSAQHNNLEKIRHDARSSQAGCYPAVMVSEAIYCGIKKAMD
jgi:hypothetical protein